MIECCKHFSLPDGEAISLWHNELEVVCPECGSRFVLVLMRHDEYQQWEREKSIAYHRAELKKLLEGEETWCL